METNELKIGNYIEFINDVTSGIAVKFEVRDFDCLDRIKPIPLTEEWLLKFGFEKSIKPNEAIFFTMQGENFRFTKNKRNDFYLFGYEYPIQIKYVHQLQNLFFVLTDEELTQ